MNIHTSGYLYERDAILRLEQQACETLDLNASQLMQRAGQATFELLLKRWPDARRITILCGAGHNAGDGYVLALLCHKKGLEVQIVQLASDEQLVPTTAEWAQTCRQAGVFMSLWSCHTDHLSGADILVDAILGTGLQREIRGEYRQVIEQVNASKKPVLAIDIPSGVHADGGSILGVAIRATLTITWIAFKQGLFTGAGVDCSGEVLLDRLGLPESVLAQVKPSVAILNRDVLTPLHQPRIRHAHKGKFGHTLLIGGNYGMGGAICMAAMAAARVGSGLVSVATRPEHVGVVTGLRPELMCCGVQTESDMKDLVEKASIIVIGPGLGQDRWAETLLEAVLNTGKNLVLDADALNLLADHPRRFDRWILTPHPGELARMLDCTVEEVQNQRFLAIHQLQQRYGGICILKGAGTLISTGEGIPYLCTAGNPGMATGGMGDVLTGTLGGLLAQQLSLEDAAKIAVFIHATAADMAAQEEGERGLLATDLFVYLRRLMNVGTLK